MEDYIKTLEVEFARNANAEIALGQKAYMKNRFEFYGIKSPIRREVQRPFLHKAALPPKDDLEGIVKTLWEKPQREFQYFSQELVFKYVKKMEEKDIALFEFMVVNKSWWDTVDFISVKLMGEYFKKYPDERDKLVENWITSGNMWLQRSALLFQLNYREELDPGFLTYVINSLLGSKEFFINKAIGWVLRNYGKTNPDWVIGFAEKSQLANLSKREALRLIK
ncbi:MAG: DNA alkylation repair protein [Chlorobi bacterium]|nr:DNA alkylation repair protein [Chlorobiota bacterium]